MSIFYLFPGLLCFISLIIILSKLNRGLKNREGILLKIKYINGTLSIPNIAGNLNFWYLALIGLTSKDPLGYYVYILINSGISTLFFIPAILGLQYGTNKNLIVLLLNFMGATWICYWLVQFLILH